MSSYVSVIAVYDGLRHASYRSMQGSHRMTDKHVVCASLVEPVYLHSKAWLIAVGLLRDYDGLVFDACCHVADHISAAAEEQAGSSNSAAAPHMNGNAASHLKISEEDQQQLFDDDDDDDDDDLDDDDDGDMTDDDLDQLEASINKSSLQ